jgi:hypothetical protein
MNKKLIIISLCILLIGGGGYVYATRVVFRDPKNCTVCHYMAPFYKNWQTSSHNKVPCLKCHEYNAERAMIGQFMFLAGAYNPRPLANIPDKNCLQKGCHDKRLMDSKVDITSLGMTFDHKPHYTEMMRGIKLHCRSCHSNIVQGEHMVVSFNVCFLCHFKGASRARATTACTSCHSAPIPPITVNGKVFSHNAAAKAGYSCTTCHVETVKGDGVTPQDKCFFCHVDRSGQYSEVKLIHDKHVAQKQIDCLWCHPKIEHGNIRMAKKMPLPA